MGDAKDCFDILEEEHARRLMKQQIVIWVEEVKPLLLKLRLHSDPDVQEAASDLQAHIVRLITGEGVVADSGLVR